MKSPAQPKIKMLGPAKPGKPQKTVNIDQDKKAEYEKRGYKYIGLGKQEFDTAERPKKPKDPKGTKEPKKLIGTTAIPSSDTTTAKFYKRQKESKEFQMNLFNFCYGLMSEDEENKKKILLDDEKESEEVVEQDNLDDEVEEQNTTAAIAGYNMPLGAGRPSVTDQNKLPKDYYKPGNKQTIKAIDSGPVVDKTYSKYKWPWEGSNDHRMKGVNENDLMKFFGV